MKTLWLSMGCVLTLAGCVSAAPELAWGKAGVSRVEYGTDIGMCSGLAAIHDGGNGANTAGGINGRNNAPEKGNEGAAGGQPGINGPSRDAPMPAGGAYSGMASADYAQRAATQQRTREMAEQRARAETLKSCLAERGYSEFALTAEQREHLSTLRKGGNEYHEYLYELSSDADVLDKQARASAR
jgi:hypothetical protein